MAHPRKWLVPTLYIVFLMLPIYGLLAMSFKTTNEILGGFSFFPQDFTLDNYRKIHERYTGERTPRFAEDTFGYTVEC